MKIEDLREKRKKEGLSQQELADQLCIGRSTLSLIERGERKPSFELMSRISRFFKEPVEIV